MAAPAARPKAGERLHFLDSLRIFLLITVMFFHLSIIYAANTAFYYLEPNYQDVPALVLLVLYQILTQAFHMGFFFLIAGFFTPGSFNRRGPATFLKSRLIRLGIPLVIYELVFSPIASIGLYHLPASLGVTIPPFTWQQYPSLIGIGPMWFVLMLLVFDSGYALWRLARRGQKNGRPARSLAVPSYRAVGVYILGLGLASYLLRIVLPLGDYWPKTAVLNFPSLAYFPQYLSFFILGAVAYEHNWLQGITSSVGRVGFGVALGVTLVLLPLALLPITPGHYNRDFLGGGGWRSAIYALWDSIYAVAICLGLLVLFRRYFNRTGWLGRSLSRGAFLAYVIHIPLLVLLALALQGLVLEHLLKFGLAALIGVPLCFTVAHFVVKLRLVSRIL